MAILELKFSMTRLQEALDVTSIGKPSSVLIDPYNLSNILAASYFTVNRGTVYANGVNS